MSNYSYSIFDEVQKALSRFSREEILAKRSASIASTLESINWVDGEIDKHCEPKIIIKDKSKLNLLRLSILSYFVDNNISYYLKLALLEISQNKLELSDIRFILKSKRSLDLWLSDYIATKTGNQVFGNFLDKNEWLRAINSFSVKINRNHKLPKDHQPEKRTIGVGYRDKGTLPDSTSPGSLKDLCLTSLQNEIEESRQAAEDLTSLLEGFFW